jgi:MraZ protein
MVESESKVIFSGEYRHSLDEKNRLTIPSDWRREDMPAELFTVPDQRNEFLSVLPPQEFNRVSELVNNNPNIPPKDRRAFVRQFYSRARRCVMDRQGRIIVPEEHRQQVNLKDQVVLVGAHARFELWDPAKWSKICDSETVTYQHVADLVGL